MCAVLHRDFVARLQESLHAKKMRQAAAAGLAAPKTFGSAFGRDSGTLTAATAPELGPDDIPDELRRALLQVAEGVAHLHSQRIVHR